MAKVLFIIAPKNFRDEELKEPKDVLESAGHECKVASTTTEPCTGMLGATVTPDLNVSDVNVEEYDAVAMIGGTGVFSIIDNETIMKIFVEAKEKGKVIGAICAGPLIVANSGIMEGVRATMYPNDKYVEEYKELGVNYVKEDVVVDGKIVTACGPTAAKEFGIKLKELL